MLLFMLTLQGGSDLWSIVNLVPDKLRVQPRTSCRAGVQTSTLQCSPSTGFQLRACLILLTKGNGLSSANLISRWKVQEKPRRSSLRRGCSRRWNTFPAVNKDPFMQRRSDPLFPKDGTIVTITQTCTGKGQPQSRCLESAAVLARSPYSVVRVVYRGP